MNKVTSFTINRPLQTQKITEIKIILGNAHAHELDGHGFSNRAKYQRSDTQAP